MCDLSSYCYLCFHQDENLVVVFGCQNNYAIGIKLKYILPELLLFLNEVQISLCKKCIQSVSSFYAFKKKCMDTNAKFLFRINDQRKFINNKENDTDIRQKRKIVVQEDQNTSSSKKGRKLSTETITEIKTEPAVNNLCLIKTEPEIHQDYGRFIDDNNDQVIQTNSLLSILPSTSSQMYTSQNDPKNMIKIENREIPNIQSENEQSNNVNIHLGYSKTNNRRDSCKSEIIEIGDAPIISVETSKNVKNIYSAPNSELSQENSNSEISTEIKIEEPEIFSLFQNFNINNSLTNVSIVKENIKVEEPTISVDISQNLKKYINFTTTTFETPNNDEENQQRNTDETILNLKKNIDNSLITQSNNKENKQNEKNSVTQELIKKEIKIEPPLIHVETSNNLPKFIDSILIDDSSDEEQDHQNSRCIKENLSNVSLKSIKKEDKPEEPIIHVEISNNLNNFVNSNNTSINLSNNEEENFQNGRFIEESFTDSSLQPIKKEIKIEPTVYVQTSKNLINSNIISIDASTDEENGQFIEENVINIFPRPIKKEIKIEPTMFVETSKNLINSNIISIDASTDEENGQFIEENVINIFPRPIKKEIKIEPTMFVETSKNHINSDIISIDISTDEEMDQENGQITEESVTNILPRPIKQEIKIEPTIHIETSKNLMKTNIISINASTDEEMVKENGQFIEQNDTNIFPRAINKETKIEPTIHIETSKNLMKTNIISINASTDEEMVQENGQFIEQNETNIFPRSINKETKIEPTIHIETSKNLMKSNIFSVNASTNEKQDQQNDRNIKKKTPNVSSQIEEINFKRPTISSETSKNLNNFGDSNLSVITANEEQNRQSGQFIERNLSTLSSRIVQQNIMEQPITPLNTLENLNNFIDLSTNIDQQYTYRIDDTLEDIPNTDEFISVDEYSKILKNKTKSKSLDLKLNKMETRKNDIEPIISNYDNDSVVVNFQNIRTKFRTLLENNTATTNTSDINNTQTKINVHTYNSCNNIDSNEKSYASVNHESQKLLQDRNNQIISHIVSFDNFRNEEFSEIINTISNTYNNEMQESVKKLRNEENYTKNQKENENENITISYNVQNVENIEKFNTALNTTTSEIYDKTQNNVRKLRKRKNYNKNTYLEEDENFVDSSVDFIPTDEEITENEDDDTSEEEKDKQIKEKNITNNKNVKILRSNKIISNISHNKICDKTQDNVRKLRNRENYKKNIYLEKDESSEDSSDVFIPTDEDEISSEEERGKHIKGNNILDDLDDKHIKGNNILDDSTIKDNQQPTPNKEIIVCDNSNNNNKTNLENNISYNATKEAYQCNICKKIFTKIQLIEQHCDAHITSQINYFINKHSLPEYDVEKKYQCPFCEHTFYFSFLMHYHLRKHQYYCAIRTNDQIINAPVHSFKFVFQIKNECNVTHFTVSLVIPVLEEKGKYISAYNIIGKKLYDHIFNPDFKLDYVLHINNILSRFKLDMIDEVMELTKKNENDAVPCVVCAEVYPRRLMGFHVMGHRKTRCPICFKKVKTTTLLYSHITLKHIKAKKYQCAICLKKYQVKSFLLAHEAIHKEEMPHICEICGKKYSSAYALSNHKKYHDESKKTLQCDLCGRKFLYDIQLEIHRKSHSKIVKTDCDICGKKFKCVSNLQQHMYSHKGIKKFQCEKCGKKFLLRTHLKQHLATHSDAKEFKCYICSKAFRDNSCLQRHIQIHSKIRKKKKLKNAIQDNEEDTDVEDNLQLTDKEDSLPLSEYTKPIEEIDSLKQQESDHEISKEVASETTTENIETRRNSKETEENCDLFGIRTDPMQQNSEDKLVEKNDESQSVQLIVEN